MNITVKFSEVSGFMTSQSWNIWMKSDFMTAEHETFRQISRNIEWLITN